MFLCELLQSDDFYTLPAGAQMLYIHLNLSADDDGFVGNPKRIARCLGLRAASFNALAEHGYIIIFNSGVIVIAHWLLNNQIRRDRYTETRFKDELNELKIVNNVYVKCNKSEEDQGLSDFCDNQKTPQGNAMQKRKEEINLNQSRKNKVSGGTHAGEEDEESSYTDRLTGEERLEYNRFLNKLKLFYMKEYGDTDVTEFIKECEGKNWLNKKGRSIKDNYQAEIKKWKIIYDAAKLLKRKKQERSS